MAFIEDLADRLACDVLAAQQELGDDRFYEQVARTLMAASPTLHEAYMTSIRIRLAEMRGRMHLEKALQDKRLAGGSSAAPQATD